MAFSISLPGNYGKTALSRHSAVLKSDSLEMRKRQRTLSNYLNPINLKITAPTSVCTKIVKNENKLAPEIINCTILLKIKNDLQI